MTAAVAHLSSDEISAPLDSLAVKWLHLFVLGVCALGLFLEVMEISFSNALAAIFSPASGESHSGVTLMLSSVYIGAVIGSPAFGVVSDRYGRVKALVGVLAVLAVSSAMAAASPSMGWLTVARALTGLSVGAYQPVFVAYLTDLLPPLRRGLLFFSCIALGFLGFPAGALLIRYLTPLQPMGVEAWRWACIAGAVGAAIVALLAVWLPESPRWLLSRGRTREAHRMLERFQSSSAVSAAGGQAKGMPSIEPSQEFLPASGSRVAVIGAMFFVSPWATVTFPMLTGAVLMGKGFKLTDALLYVALSTFGPVFGTLLTAVYVDRVPRRISLVVCSLVMLVSGYVFCGSNTPFWLVTSNLAFTVATALYVPLMNVYCAELLPTSTRARVFSGAWAANRLGAAIAPIALLPLLHGMGAPAMFVVVAASLIIGIVLLQFALPGRQRLSVL
jgi:putative MFS transporter